MDPFSGSLSSIVNSLFSSERILANIQTPSVIKLKCILCYIFYIIQTQHPWEQCETIVEGEAEVGGQEHLYIETQGAYAIPLENGKMMLHSSTQGTTLTQKVVARVLGIAMHQLEVEVRRLGGGFGGKEDQATCWASMAALAAHHTGCPVKMVLNRHDDIKMTGKRHPYRMDYKIGLDENLKIIAYQVDFYQNSGAACDLSPAVLERTLFHCTNSYFIPNVKATAVCCRTNLVPNTAFRGFGGPQGMFVIEAAIAKAAEKLAIDKAIIQRKNLIQEGDTFPYGQIAEACEAQNTFEQCYQQFDYEKRCQQVTDFNQSQNQLKKGLAFMPICFGIAFTKLFFNQARALMHVY